MSEQYKDDFDKGVEFASGYFNPETGKMVKELPHPISNAFAEGLLTGKSNSLSRAFPGYRSIHWENGKAIVT